jgi:hypothetical protein
MAKAGIALLPREKKIEAGERFPSISIRRLAEILMHDFVSTVGAAAPLPAPRLLPARSVKV